MANGHGGARPGAGRKRKSDAARKLHGSRGRWTAAPATGGGDVPVHPEVDDVPVPEHLTKEERGVWLRLAPHAIKLNTLKPESEYQFELLCSNIVLERTLRRDVATRGNSDHRGIITAIDRELLRFCLAPMGKPILPDQPAKPEDPFTVFDTPVVSVAAGSTLQ